MTVLDELSRNGVVNIDCASEGLTLDQIVRLIASQPDRVRLDDVSIVPTMVNGRLVLTIEISARHRHVADDAALYLDVR